MNLINLRRSLLPPRGMFFLTHPKVRVRKGDWFSNSKYGTDWRESISSVGSTVGEKNATHNLVFARRIKP